MGEELRLAIEAFSKLGENAQDAFLWWLAVHFVKYAITMGVVVFGVAFAYKLLKYCAVNGFGQAPTNLFAAKVVELVYDEAAERGKVLDSYPEARAQTATMKFLIQALKDSRPTK